MPTEQRRAVSCFVCGKSHISATYRTEDVVYLQCDDCGAVWPVDAQTSEEAIPEILCRIKIKQDTPLSEAADRPRRRGRAH